VSDPRFSPIIGAAVADVLANRTNLALARTEGWRPPLHSPPNSRTRRWLAALRRLVDLQAGSIWRDLAGELAAIEGLVLDVGCGAQPYRCLLGPSARYLGIDTADAKPDFGYEIRDTVYFEGDSWPVNSESVDVVLCTETLEHVLQPRKLLAEAHRALVPGGRLLLTVPFAARWHFVPHDYWRFTPSSLRYLLETAGFADVAVYARGNAFTVACYKVIALVLPYLFPQHGGLRARAVQLIAVLAIPFVVVLALAARSSLLGKGGDDCLGYTVTAVRT
jgi:SAM-dependent methyltransferase